MLFGMGPVTLLLNRFLHPDIHTRVEFGVKFNVHHRLLFILLVIPRSSIWEEHLKTIHSRLAMTPFRQGYSHENKGCQVPNALENVASKSLGTTKVSAHMTS